MTAEDYLAAKLAEIQAECEKHPAYHVGGAEWHALSRIVARWEDRNLIDDECERMWEEAEEKRLFYAHSDD